MKKRTFASLIGLLLWSGIAHSQAPAPAAPRPPVPPRDGSAATSTGTARIRGRVLAADTGDPIRRAQVRLSAGQPGVQQIVTTDADGRYELGSLPASSYTISVSRNGYVTLQFGQQRPFEPGKSLTLAEGQTMDKIDFALPRGGVITGRLVDDTGEPVPAVRIQVQRYQYQAGGVRRLVTASANSAFSSPATDDLGQFRVYGLMPGSYVLSAIADTIGTISMTAGPASISTGPNVSANGFATTYFPGTANPDEAQNILVSVGEEATASFALISTRMTRISGVVRNSQGNPVARASLNLVTRSASSMSSMGGSTQPDGSFVIANVPPGEHAIEVRPARIPPASPSTAPDELATVVVTANGQDITGLIITTGPGATISGRLIFDGKSEIPQGLAQAIRVSPSAADPSAPISSLSSLDMGVPDETGRFQLAGVSGRMVFRTGSPFGAPPLQGWFLKSVTLNGIDITDTPYDAKPSTNITGLEVTMTDRQTTLSGGVANLRGDTVKDFVVAIFPAVAREGAAATRFTRTIRPDQQGRYQVKGLPPGDYVAVAVESLEQGAEWDPAFQQQMKPRGKSFRLTDGQTSALDLILVQ